MSFRVISAHKFTTGGAVAFAKISSLNAKAANDPVSLSKKAIGLVITLSAPEAVQFPAFKLLRSLPWDHPS